MHYAISNEIMFGGALNKNVIISGSIKKLYNRHFNEDKIALEKLPFLTFKSMFGNIQGEKPN